MIRSPKLFRPSLTAVAAILLASAAIAQVRPVSPVLNSNPGATYTLYLDFASFVYNGTWGGGTPGTVPAYDLDGDQTTFSAAETTQIKNTWARYANAYKGFNINITTVDPAAAGSTDSQRQTYYDQTRYVMHTLMGANNSWFGSAGGVSYVGTIQNANTFSGGHNNWVFSSPNQQLGSSGNDAKGMAAAGIHEDGHGLSLNHQTDENNGAGYSNNNNAQGNGSYAPIMGTTYVSQRGTWRQGKAGTNANDVAVLESNANIGDLADDGIGHSFATATSLAVAANGTVNTTSSRSKGFIMPTKASGYTAQSYTTDYFAFASLGGAVTLTANDGDDLLQAGVADAGATMRCVMKIFTSTGILAGTAVESADTLTHTFTGNLGIGNYYAQILSYGAYVSAYEPSSQYFNMGGYFLTGSGLQAVPEPTTLVAVGLGALTLLRRRRRSV